MSVKQAAMHAVPALSSNLGRGKPRDQSMDTFMALVTFQNSIRVPTPALINTTLLVSLSSKYRKMISCINTGIASGACALVAGAMG